jgi:hypothetical protein
MVQLYCEPHNTNCIINNINTGLILYQDRKSSRQVASTMSDDIIDIFHWRNASGLTTARGSTQRLTEMSTRNISCEVSAADP